MTNATESLQRVEQKLIQGGAALPVKTEANGVEHGLSIALLLVRDELAALAAAPAAPAAHQVLAHAADAIERLGAENDGLRAELARVVASARGLADAISARGATS